MEHVTIAGRPVAFLPADGPPLAGPADVIDVIGQTYGTHAQWVAIPTTRLPAEFFDLKTRLAGEVLQKFANYHLRVAILGDIAGAVAASGALADFVRESNRGRQVWFLADRQTFEAALAAL